MPTLDQAPARLRMTCCPAGLCALMLPALLIGWPNNGLLAQQAEPPADQSRAKEQQEASEWTVILGAGGTFGPDYEGSDDLEFQTFPLIVIEYGDIARFRGNQATVSLLRSSGPLGEDEIEAGPMARFVFGRNDNENNALDGLGDVENSIEVGGFLRYGVGPWSSELSVLQDVAGGHEGLVVAWEAGRRFQLMPRVGLETGVAISWADGTYMDSYFTINGAQAAASGLDEFDADAGFKDVGAKVGVNVKLTSRWALNGEVQFDRLLGDAADSPIVDDEGSPNQIEIRSFLGYRF